MELTGTDQMDQNTFFVVVALEKWMARHEKTRMNKMLNGNEKCKEINYHPIRMIQKKIRWTFFERKKNAMHEIVWIAMHEIVWFLDSQYMV